MTERYRCNACGQPCDAYETDDGVGYTKMGSQGHYDSRPYVASDCCDAGLYDPAECVEDEREWGTQWNEL